ncbi:MAG TPA: urea ABC transporter permease subunit UrtB, partial [Burkholderiales bacterium]|nr:urea ABC transporter permease subunit UrtB [Burkholderiales bacterium]
MSIRLAFLSLLAFALLMNMRAASAVTPDQLQMIAAGENEQKVEAINALVAAGDNSALPLLQAFSDGQLQSANGKAFIVKDSIVIDAATGKTITPAPDGLEDIMVNNRIRRTLDSAIAALKLTSKDRDTRIAAMSELEKTADEEMLPLITRALASETDEELKSQLTLVHASLQLKSKDAPTRLAAVKALADSKNPNTRTLLLGVLEKNSDAFVEPESNIRSEARLSLKKVESRLEMGERVGQLFTGLSLGSILLLAALGLAITYGLMGVINMAHGELIMVGAYATYVVQNVFRAYAPEWFDWYLALAVPIAFFAAALVGAVLERTVIRFLYGRPLETLLATWGISLILVQAVRTFFGAQNVAVENPVWMSGGVQLLSNVVLPYNRIVIIGFAVFVLVSIWLLLSRTRLGLFVRSVTQNRAMASCVGVPTARVDTMAFALGSGIAGLAGCALS